MCVLLLRTNFQFSLRATSSRNLKHAIRQKNCNQWYGPIYPQFEILANRLQSFSPWPPSSDQNAGDLSEGGFFYTGNVFYKQKPVY